MEFKYKHWCGRAERGRTRAQPCRRYSGCQVNIGTPKNGHPGCPYSRKYRHPDAHIYVNMGTPGCPYLRGVYIFMTPVAALLGTDIPQLGELLRIDTQTRSTNTMNNAMVVTRTQAEREKECSSGTSRGVVETPAPVGFSCPPRARALSRGPPRGRARRTPHSRRTGACQVRWRPAQRRADGQVVQAVAFFAAGGELTAVGPARAGPTRREVACFHPSSTGVARAVAREGGRSASVRSASALRDCSQCPASACRSGRETSHGQCCGGLASRWLQSTRLETRTEELGRCCAKWQRTAQTNQWAISEGSCLRGRSIPPSRRRVWLSSWLSRHSVSTF